MISIMLIWFVVAGIQSINRSQRMDILYNNNLINEIVDKLFRHKRTDYSEFNLQYLLDITDIEHEVHRVANQNYEKLYASLFKKTPNPDVCIVFMHGYGSNRLECTNILKELPNHYALCCFDFSGSGKSEGDLITYGMKEKEDINSIISYLRLMSFKKFILWGRSMGATSSLLYCIKYKPSDVILQIVDSPFYSFEMIAFEIASKNVKAPQFLISFALQMAKKNCQKFQHNPFAIELKDVGECQVTALFLYHQEDSVINSQNTHLICSKYKGTFEKLMIEENHNTVRSQNTIQKVFSFIDKYSKKTKPRLTESLNALYFDYKTPSARYDSTPSRKAISRCDNSIDQSDKKSSGRKGIERVKMEEFSKIYDDYGACIPTKIKREVIIGTPQAGEKKKTGSQIKPHLSLSSSITSKNIKGIDHGLSPSFSQLGKEHLATYQFNAKTMESQKKRGGKKLGTVKSMGTSRCMNPSKMI